ncbi:MAG: hypothetical protein ACT4RN_05345 [Pseudonocardia sp.]
MHGLGVRRRRTHRCLVRRWLLPGPTAVGLVVAAPGEPHEPAEPTLVEHTALARPLRAGLVAELVDLISTLLRRAGPPPTASRVPSTDSRE